jgi:hypothetical protein
VAPEDASGRETGKHVVTGRKTDPKSRDAATKKAVSSTVYGAELHGPSRRGHDFCGVEHCANCGIDLSRAREFDERGMCSVCAGVGH